MKLDNRKVLRYKIVEIIKKKKKYVGLSYIMISKSLLCRAQALSLLTYVRVFLLQVLLVWASVINPSVSYIS